MTISEVVSTTTQEPGRPPVRTIRQRHYVMTPPTTGGGTSLAARQWQALREIYRDLGHTVDIITPGTGLPDMMYTASGALVLDDGIDKVAIIARFADPQRDPESVAYANWMGRHGYCPLYTEHPNEGQADLLVIGRMILAGYGFRTDRRAHDEVAKLAGLPVLNVQLVNSRFYHLDTALAVLDDTTIAFYPTAFGAQSVALLRNTFPGAIEVSDADAQAQALNSVSDGYHVVYPATATRFAAQLSQAGFAPIGMDTSALGEGSVKSCTLEVYPVAC